MSKFVNKSKQNIKKQKKRKIIIKNKKITYNKENVAVNSRHNFTIYFDMLLGRTFKSFNKRK